MIVKIKERVEPYYKVGDILFDDIKRESLIITSLTRSGEKGKGVNFYNFLQFDGDEVTYYQLKPLDDLRYIVKQPSPLTLYSDYYPIFKAECGCNCSGDLIYISIGNYDSVLIVDSPHSQYPGIPYLDNWDAIDDLTIVSFKGTVELSNE